MAPDGKYFTRSTSPSRLDVATVILVEGSDDGYFLDEVLTSIDAPVGDVGVCVADGKDKFVDLLKVILKAPTFTSGKIRRYAIIRDVDENLAACQSECSRLFNSVNEPLPQPNSFTVRADGRYNGLFLMPSSTEVGSLETLALKTLGDHPLLNAANGYLASSQNQGGSSDHMDKRRVQALLATLASPLCNGVGFATKKGYFDIASPTLAELKSFLIELQSK